jgi:hypothetical protein
VPKATSISVEKLSSTVAAAVKAAVQKHPNIKVDPATSLSLSYLIWGIPVPEPIAGALTMREAQAFANDVAAQLGPGLPGAQLEGAVFSHGGHLIIGIPVPPEVLIGR